MGQVIASNFSIMFETLPNNPKMNYYRVYTTDIYTIDQSPLLASNPRMKLNFYIEVRF